MSNFSFSIDDDTKIIFDATVWCLKKFFKHSDESAIRAVNNYYVKNKDRFDNSDWGDDFYHYEGPFSIALRINYSEVLGLGVDLGEEFAIWMRNNEDLDISREVHIYLRKLYK